MTEPTFQRARSSAAKDARLQAILQSAREQATARSVREVTLTDVAAGVGMHKSTMLRYFETREDIFLTLAALEWSEWATEVSAQLSGIAPHSASARSVAEILSVTLASRPFFCDLLAHVPLNLERGVSLSAVKTFKLTALNAARKAAGAVQAATTLQEASARNVIATATAMAGSFWQMAAPGTTLRKLYETDPELGHAIVDVQPRLIDILEALILGSAATR